LFEFKSLVFFKKIFSLANLKKTEVIKIHDKNICKLAIKLLLKKRGRIKKNKNFKIFSDNFIKIGVVIFLNDIFI